MSSAVVAQRMSIRRLRPVERDLWNIGGAHSALMLAARITLPHFSVPLAMNFPNSLGEVENAVAPSG